jgi:Xaa-Pro aminopeptidase
MAISGNEFERRHQAIRGAMGEQGIDCLIIAGRPDYFNRGNVRYVTNLALGGVVLFPAEGKPVYFVSVAQICSPNHEKAGPIGNYLELKRISDPVTQVVDELSHFDGGKRIGVVGSTEMPVPLYLRLAEILGSRMVDSTSIFRDLRIIKSIEEMDKMRVSASIADSVCLMLKEMIRPGVSDYEIYGAVKNRIYQMECEYSMDLIDARGSTMNMAWGPIGNRLEDHGTLFMEITPAYDGYYAQLPVCLPVGRCSPALSQAAAVWNEAMEESLPLLRPGMMVGNLYKKSEEVVRRNGFVSPLPAGHAIGLDAIDFWTINGENTTKLQTGMTIAFHPCVLSLLGGDGIGMGYTYLITDNGAQKLSALDVAW